MGVWGVEEVLSACVFESENEGENQLSIAVDLFIKSLVFEI